MPESLCGRLPVAVPVYSPLSTVGVAMNKTVLALLVASVLSPFVADGRAQTPTIEQSLDLKSVGGPRISPDGRYVAYQVQKTNWEENAFETEIWMGGTATGEWYRLPNA